MAERIRILLSPASRRRYKLLFQNYDRFYAKQNVLRIERDKRL